MKLRDINVSKKLIPDFNGNTLLPKEEQVVIHFSRIPGRSEKTDYINFKMDSTKSMSMIYNDSMLINAFVESVENLEDGKGNKITTGKHLAECYAPELDELFDKIRDHLFPVDEDLTVGESTT